MTVEDYVYYDKYKRNLNKFIFKEGKKLSNKEYIMLNDEVRNIEQFLKSNEKFLQKTI